MNFHISNGTGFLPSGSLRFYNSVWMISFGFNLVAGIGQTLGMREQEQ
jgi:hypothetical protein